MRRDGCVLVSVVDVAYRIANGDPPKWLIPALEYFREWIFVVENPDKEIKKRVEFMQEAADTLLKNLPMFLALPFGWQAPKEVQIVLAALPLIKKDLDRLSSYRQRGRKPDVDRELCAAVIVEAWKLVNGKAQPRSEGFLEACNLYWGVYRRTARRGR
jgi:hypothetical protein